MRNTCKECEYLHTRIFDGRKYCIFSANEGKLSDSIVPHMNCPINKKKIVVEQGMKNVKLSIILSLVTILIMVACATVGA